MRDKAVPAPWLVHGVLALGGFAIGTTEFATMSLLPDFSAGLGVDAPTGGHAISIYALGVVVGAPLLAIAGARAKRRTMLILLMTLFAIGNLASAFVPSFAMLVACRFLAGIPHGAYFGTAALVAVSVVPRERRTAAVGRVMSGLAIATIIGVPAANIVGQWLGWRWGFGIVAVLAAVTAIAVSIVVPDEEADAGASPLRELGALRRAQVWLALGTGAIGFGGLFAIYSYLASTLDAVTHASAEAVPLVFATFGVGLTLGNIIVPRFADRALAATTTGLLVWSALAMAVYPFTAGNTWTIAVAVAAIGIGGSLGTVLQARLMDVAGDAQTLAASLHHAAFNLANALGPWLAGLAITAGYGWTSAGWVGTGLAMGGLVIWQLALFLERVQAAPAARSVA